MGAPNRAVIAERGSSTGDIIVRAIKSHRLVTTPPRRSVAGIRIRLSELEKIIRAMWGTASPIKATGPARDVISPAMVQALRRMKIRKRLMLMPIDRAYSSPSNIALRGFDNR